MYMYAIIKRIHLVGADTMYPEDVYMYQDITKIRWSHMLLILGYGRPCRIRTIYVFILF